jgi:hypothetical protein
MAKRRDDEYARSERYMGRFLDGVRGEPRSTGGEPIVSNDQRHYGRVLDSLQGNPRPTSTKGAKRA